MTRLAMVALLLVAGPAWADTVIVSGDSPHVTDPNVLRWHTPGTPEYAAMTACTRHIKRGIAVTGNASDFDDPWFAQECLKAAKMERQDEDAYDARQNADQTAKDKAAILAVTGK